MDITNAQRARVLVHALPYIKKYNGKIVVIKYGGNAMQSEKLKNSVMGDIVLLSLIGAKVVLVHGGGPEITDMLKTMGKKTEFVNGLRVTDEETAQVAQMILAGKINKSLVNLISKKGGNAVGLCGIDGRIFEAKKLSDELGFVGEITKVNAGLVSDILEKGYIPVISTLGCDSEGNAYNINGDTAAAKIAGALKAERFLLMTDIAGVMKDKDDPSTLIPEISKEEAEKYYEDGTISGGMIPKVQCCFDAIDDGVKSVVIMNGTIPHSILIELLTNEGAGTMFNGGSK